MSKCIFTFSSGTILNVPNCPNYFTFSFFIK